MIVFRPYVFGGMVAIFLATAIGLAIYSIGADFQVSVQRLLIFGIPTAMVFFAFHRRKTAMIVFTAYVSVWAAMMFSGLISPPPDSNPFDCDRCFFSGLIIVPWLFFWTLAAVVASMAGAWTMISKIFGFQSSS
jgi:hypothetical protein